MQMPTKLQVGSDSELKNVPNVLLVMIPERLMLRQALYNTYIQYNAVSNLPAMTSVAQLS